MSALVRVKVACVVKFLYLGPHRYVVCVREKEKERESHPVEQNRAIMEACRSRRIRGIAYLVVVLFSLNLLKGLQTV